MNKNQFKSEFLIEVYLHNYKKPIKIIVDDNKMVDKFYAFLDNENKYFKFGQLILDKTQFRFAVVTEKIKKLL